MTVVGGYKSLMGVTSRSLLRASLFALMVASSGCDSAKPLATERRLVYEQMTVSDVGAVCSVNIMGRPFSHPARKQFPHFIESHESGEAPLLYVDREGDTIVRLVVYIPNFDRGCNWGWAREIDVSLGKGEAGAPVSERQRQDARLLAEKLCQMSDPVVAVVYVKHMPVKLGNKEDKIPTSMKLTWSGVVPGEASPRQYSVVIDFQAENFKVEEQAR